MNKYILTINGMKCGMCESHVNDLFRKKLDVKKVTSSHVKNQTIVITLKDYNEIDFKNALDGSGYIVENVLKEEAKKGLFGWK